jgi:hypothetical protein
MIGNFLSLAKVETKKLIKLSIFLMKRNLQNQLKINRIIYIQSDQFKEDLLSILKIQESYKFMKSIWILYLA